MELSLYVKVTAYNSFLWIYVKRVKFNRMS